MKNPPKRPVFRRLVPMALVLGLFVLPGCHAFHYAVDVAFGYHDHDDHRRKKHRRKCRKHRDHHHHGRRGHRHR